MAKPEVLSSAKNPFLKDVRRAALRGTLTADGYCIAETFHLLEEALRSDLEVKAVLAAESVHSAVENHVRGLRRTRVTVVPDSLFEDLSATESAQGVMALVKPPSWTLDHLFRGASLVTILDGLQDPGNAGAIIRTSEAFGVTGLMFLKGTVSPWNPKTVRASAGSIFRVPLVFGLDPSLARASLRQRSIDVYAAVADSGKPPHEANLTRRCALVIGSEGRGVSEDLRDGAEPIQIRTCGVESLNASVAAAVILYEAHRQRIRA